jgi:DNA replication and repair protein RecF
MSQRNALLKYFALNHVLIPIHSIYNEQRFWRLYFREKKNFNQFIPIFNTHHQAITGSQETVQLVYESHL